MRTTLMFLRLLFSTSIILLCFSPSFGFNYEGVDKSSDISNIHHKPNSTITKTFSLIENKSIFDHPVVMEDTACTANSIDTFFVNSSEDVISYNWTIPTGAIIESTMDDTMIVINWTNAAIGLSEVCVESVNDCGASTPFCIPIRVLDCNMSPNALDDSQTILSNTTATVQVQLNDSDPENDKLTTNLDASNGPSNGTVSINNDDIIYVPNTNFTGLDTFNYYICDSGFPTQCDTAIVVILVQNSPPIALPDAITTMVDMPVRIPVQNNDSDPENQDLTTSLDPNQGPSKGQVTISGDDIIYTPNPGSQGIDQFNYIICDNDTPSLCDTSTVTVSISNQLPIAQDDRDTTFPNTTVSIPVQINDRDPEGQGLVTSIGGTNPPSNGTISLSGNNILYTPNPNFTGTDSFDYIVCESNNASLCATATVTVVVLNTAPNAVDDVASTNSNTPVSIPVINNDTDSENGSLVVSLEPNNGPNNGSVAISGDNIIYTPAPGFTGTDVFDYVICDNGNPILCDTATVTVTVNNLAPIAFPDNVVTPFNTAIVIDVQNNDIDSENGILSTNLNPSFPPSNGTVNVINNDNIQYVPNNGFKGVDQFGYIICDNGIPIQCDTTIVTVTVPNEGPIAVNDNYTTPEDTALNGQVLTNDSDPNNDNIVVNPVLVSGPTNGTVSITTNGSFTYIPATNFNGPDQFQYQICDNDVAPLCDTATVFITIEAQNDAPLAQDDRFFTNEDVAVAGNVSPNDSDFDSQNLVVNTTPIDGPNNGTLTLSPDGTFIYAPNSNFTGDDVFFYEICDDGLPALCDTARVVISVLPIDDAPIAVDDNYTTDEDVAVAGNVLPNDNDIENENLTVNTTPVDGPDNGTLTLNTNGTFTYVPDPNYTGQDIFFYEVCDGVSPILCDTAKVTITIHPIDDAPTAVDDNYTTDEDVAVAGNVLPNDSDIENENLTVNIIPVDGPDNGIVTLNPNGSFVYAPGSNYTGQDIFFYEVCDEASPILCDTARVTITINPIDDGPTAVDDNYTTDEDVAVAGNVLPNDSDIENENLTVNIVPVDEPNNGTVTLNPDGSFVYAPSNNYNGQDIFFYEVCDEASPILCDTAKVTIIINPIDDAPTAVDDNYTTDEDVAVAGNVLPNDSDIENENLTVNIVPVDGPDNGTVTLNPDGSFVYFPSSNYTGQDIFFYEVCDEASPVLCDTAKVTITINPIDDAPIAVDDTYSTNEDTPVSGSVLPNDIESDNEILNVTSATDGPDNGVLDLNSDGTFIYTPNPNFTGQDTFLYEVCDDLLPILCDTAQVIIYVYPQNDAPIAINDINVTTVNIPTSGNILLNDFEPENDPIILTTTPINDVDNGMVVIDEDGAYTYTPNKDFAGEDIFTYQICDNGTPALCDTAEVVIVVIGNDPFENDPPVAINDNFVTIINTTIPNINLLTNDFDVDGDDLIVNVNPIQNPANGIVNIQSNGVAVYTPNTDYLGKDVFTYQICDNAIPSLCDTAKVTITIFTDGNNRNTTFANDDAGVTFKNASLSGILNDNDSDPEGDNQLLQLNPAILPTNGMVTINPNGAFVYTPNRNYVGPDQFRYVTCDDGTPVACDTATVYITVLPINEPPIAVNDINVTPVNIPTSGNVLSNDFDPEGATLILLPLPIDYVDNGLLTLHPDGSYDYTPNLDFTGEDVFTYQICDNGAPNLCDTAEVVITVIGNDPLNNDPPIAINDNFVTLINIPITNINLLTNDFDTDGNDIFTNVTPISFPQNGSVIIQSDGIAHYTPNQGFLGKDIFTYEICDNGIPNLCDTAKVTISIFSDGVLENTTFAGDDAGLTFEDTPLLGVLSDNDNDPEGDNQILQTTPAYLPTNGTITINMDGSFVYIPGPNYVGPDRFRYVLCDDGAPVVCDTATVYITVLGVNDKPVALEDVNNTILNTPVSGNVLTNDIEFENNSLVFSTSLAGLPSYGQVVLFDNGDYTYTPNTGFVGEDRFEYEVCDDQNPQLCDVTHVIIEVLTANPNENNPPNGVEDNIQTAMNLPYEGTVLSNDYDIDGDILTVNPNIISSVSSRIFSNKQSNPQNGSVVLQSDGSFTYTPNQDFHGEDNFYYEVCDDGVPSMCDTVLVTVDIIPNPLNENRIYAVDDAATLWEDAVVSGNLVINDHHPDKSQLLIKTTPVQQPENGIVTISANGDFVYTPNNNYNGPDRFLYNICHVTEPTVCDTATVYFTVIPLQDPPIAKNDINLTLVNTPVNGQVLINDEEPDGDNLIVTITPIINPQHGTVSLTAAGTYFYQPATDYVGQDNFTYAICDDASPVLCDTAIVTINILEVKENENNPPIANNDVTFGKINKQIIGSLAVNDFDPDGHPITTTITPISNPTNGTISIAANGTYTYTPANGYSGTDEVTYEICDIFTPKACDTAILYITILPYDDNFVFANDDHAVGEEDSQITGTLLANDYDPEGNDFTINNNLVSLPAHGEVVVDENGLFVYTPIEDYNGPDNFSYEICDNGTPIACDIATAYLTVLPVPDTACTEPLQIPTLLSNEAICFTEDIHLFIQENYEVVVDNGVTTPYEFIWYNALGIVLDTTTAPNFTLAAQDVQAISPFTVQVKLGQCKSDLATPLEIDVRTLPNIVITASSGNNAVCKGSAIELTASQMANATYEWTAVGDPTIIGTSRTLVIPNYEVVTTYEVKVFPELCDTFASDNITINVSSEIDFDPSRNYLIHDNCAGSDLTLLTNRVNSATGFNFLWTGPNGFSSTEENPVIENISEAFNGTYSITISNETGCSTTKSIFINDLINAVNQPTITASFEDCNFDDLILEVPEFIGNNITYNWYASNGVQISTTSSNRETVSNPSPDTYYHVVIQDGPCLITSDSIQPSIEQNLSVSIDEGNTTSLCGDGFQDLTLNATITGGRAPYDITWTGANGFKSFKEDPTLVNVTNDLSGTYSIEIVDANGCMTKASTEVDIKNAPDQPIITSSGSVCEGGFITLTASNYSSTDISYEWKVGNTQNVSGINTNSLTIALDDLSLVEETYILEVTVNGCTSRSVPFQLETNGLPGFNPTANYTPNSDCSNGNLSLSANISGSTVGLTYEWTGPNGFTSATENPVIIDATPANNGSYTLTLTNGSDCSQSNTTNVIDEIQIEINSPSIRTAEPVCEGGFTTLIANSYTESQVEYQWLLNDEVFEITSSPEISIGPLFDNNDTYQVRVINGKCELSSEIISPDMLPSASINPSYTLSGLCEGSTLQLNANSSNTIGTYTYTWSGPNGFTSSAINPLISNITKANNGTYTLTINSLANCQNTESITITEITDKPEQPTIITNGPVCSDGMIEMSVQEINNQNSLDYYWINGLGDTIGKSRTISLAAIDAKAIPPYFAKVNFGDCGAVSSIPINVDIIEVPLFTISNNSPICQGEAVELFSTTVSGANYIWRNTNTGEIVSTVQNPTITDIDATTTFELTIQKDGCNNGRTVATIVTVSPKPVITNLSESMSICEGSDLELNAESNLQSNSPINYTWTGPNGFVFNSISTDNTFPLSISNFGGEQDGTYNLTIGVDDNCASASQSVVISVFDELNTPTLTAETSIVCGGSDIILTASRENGANVKYEWFTQNERGDLFSIRTTSTPTIIINNATIANSSDYVVRVVKENCNSGFSNTAQIVVLAIETDITAKNNSIESGGICEGGIVQLTVPYFAGATYAWFGPAGFTSDKSNPIITDATSLNEGIYFAVITIDGCAGVTSSTTEVFINELPDAPTITNNSPVCLGNDVTIEVSSNLILNEGDKVSYEWYDATTNALVRATTQPSLTLGNINTNQAGDYYLKVIVNGCEVDASNITTVSIISIGNLQANAGPDQNLCAASVVSLSAVETSNGTGEWSSPTGAIITNPNSASTEASNLQIGLNRFVWTISSTECQAEYTDTMTVMANSLSNDKAIAGPDQELCDMTSINLGATPLTEAVGLWTQSNSQTSDGVIIVEPTNPISSVEGLSTGNSYQFIWTISQPNCPDFETDTVQFTINDIPPDNALIQEETIILCDQDQLTLNAEFPTFSTGEWLTDNEAIIANPTNPVTFVEGLDPGKNVFVWALSNGSCKHYSTDTIIVYTENTALANPDNYEINLNDTLNMDVFENDVVSSITDLDFIITKYPDNGELIEEEDGTLTYKPQSNFFGYDNFRYQICSQLCESVCDTAIVTIGVTGTEGSRLCLIPNVISPNGDGNNDFFLVSCIDQFPDNELKIFNRWGDIVYETKNYQNDWSGTHKDLPLPSGTYFYLLKLSPDAEPLKDFITIFR